MSISSARAERDLYYEENGSGVPIVLIHPSGATASTWGRFADDLAELGRLIVYDRRGYARSGGEPARSIATHTADLTELLDRLRTPPAVMVGVSVGATIAIDLARLRPELVRAVVAHESPWHVTRHLPTFAQMAALTKMSWLSSRRRYPEAAAAFLRFAYTYRDGESAWDQFPDEWQRIVSENAQASLDDIRIAIGNYPTAKEMATVGSLVVCTCGERSAKTMVTVTRSLARTIPNAAFRQIKGAGHAAAFDAPANFASIVAEVIAATRTIV